MPNQSQKPVDIGGQAVLEGVMMKGPDAIAITVRRPDKTMVVDYKKSEPLSKKHKWMGLPIIRGAVNMVNMLVMGMTSRRSSRSGSRRSSARALTRSSWAWRWCWRCC